MMTRIEAKMYQRLPTMKILMMRTLMRVIGECEGQWVNTLAASLLSSCLRHLPSSSKYIHDHMIILINIFVYNIGQILWYLYMICNTIFGTLFGNLFGTLFSGHFFWNSFLGTFLLTLFVYTFFGSFFDIFWWHFFGALSWVAFFTLHVDTFLLILFETLFCEYGCFGLIAGFWWGTPNKSQTPILRFYRFPFKESNYWYTVCTSNEKTKCLRTIHV